jgi:hypothetical protein
MSADQVYEEAGKMYNESVKLTRSRSGNEIDSCGAAGQTIPKTTLFGNVTQRRKDVSTVSWFEQAALSPSPAEH